AANAEIDVVTDPGPEGFLGLGLRVRHPVRMPASHDHVVDGPNAHPVPREVPLPGHRDRRLRVEDANRVVPREVLETADVELRVPRGIVVRDAASAARTAGQIRHAIGEDHDRDRGERQVLALHQLGGPGEERVEVRDPVVRREPLLQIQLDLLDGLPLKIVDRVERLGHALLVAADGADEEGTRDIEPAEAVEVLVDVAGGEGEGVVVIARGAERPADVDADDERASRLAVRRPLVGTGGEDSRESGGDGRREAARRSENSPHGYTSTAGRAAALERAAAGCCCWSGSFFMTSCRLPNGSWKTGCERTRTMKKLIAAARIWRTGSAASSISSAPRLRNHSCSRLNASMVSDHHATAGRAGGSAPLSVMVRVWRERIARSAGVPKRPKRNHVM